MTGQTFFMNLLPAPELLIKEELHTVVWVPLSPGRERTVLKLYRHRGLWHAFRCWLTKYRAQREFEYLSHLSRWRVPCTEPSDWAHGYSHIHGFYELLATVFVHTAIDLEAHLTRGFSCDLRPLFDAVRRMHESGLCHHALVCRNILISKNKNSQCDFAISDVARARIFPKSIVGTRLARCDLADLIYDLIRHGVPRDAIPYDAYGILPGEHRRISVMLGTYPPGKTRRLARDGESRIRHFLSHCGDALTGTKLAAGAGLLRR